MPGQTESEVCLGGVIHISHASHVSGRINVPVRTGFHGASCAIRAFLQDRAVCSFIVPCTQDALNFDLPERGTFPRQTVREKGFFHTGSVFFSAGKRVFQLSPPLPASRSSKSHFMAMSLLCATSAARSYSTRLKSCFKR